MLPGKKEARGALGEEGWAPLGRRRRRTRSGVTPAGGIGDTCPFEVQQQLFLLSHGNGFVTGRHALGCDGDGPASLPWGHQQLVKFLLFSGGSLALGAQSHHVKSSAPPKLPRCEGAQAQQRGHTWGLWPSAG